MPLSGTACSATFRAFHRLQPVLQNLSLAAAEGQVQGVYHGDGQTQYLPLQFRLAVLQGRPVQVQHQVDRILMEQILKAVAPANQPLQDDGET